MEPRALGRFGRASKLFPQPFPNPPLFPPSFSKRFFGGFGGFQGLAIAASPVLACSKFLAARAADSNSFRRAAPANSGEIDPIFGMNCHHATNSDFQQEIAANYGALAGPPRNVLYLHVATVEWWRVGLRDGRDNHPPHQCSRDATRCEERHTHPVSATVDE